MVGRQTVRVEKERRCTRRDGVWFHVVDFCTCGPDRREPHQTHRPHLEPQRRPLPSMHGHGVGIDRKDPPAKTSPRQRILGGRLADGTEAERSGIDAEATELLVRKPPGKAVTVDDHATELRANGTEVGRGDATNQVAVVHRDTRRDPIDEHDELMDDHAGSFRGPHRITSGEIHRVRFIREELDEHLLKGFEVLPPCVSDNVDEFDRLPSFGHGSDDRLIRHVRGPQEALRRVTADESHVFEA